MVFGTGIVPVKLDPHKVPFGVISGSPVAVVDPTLDENITERGGDKDFVIDKIMARFSASIALGPTVYLEFILFDQGDLSETPFGRMNIGTGTNFAVVNEPINTIQFSIVQELKVVAVGMDTRDLELLQIDKAVLGG